MNEERGKAKAEVGGTERFRDEKRGTRRVFSFTRYATAAEENPVHMTVVAV